MNKQNDPINNFKKEALYNTGSTDFLHEQKSDE